MTPNLLFTGDNLHIMYGMNSHSVDLIYLDPPFNSKRTYSAPIGSKAAGTSFKDMWSWSDVDEVCLHSMVGYSGLADCIEAAGNTHSKAMMAYLTYMAQRIAEMHRILKPTGSIYLHCDPTASHCLRNVMDAIFGAGNFRNELIWYYKNASRGKKFNARAHDVILWYSKSREYIYNREDVLQPYESGMTKWRYSKKGGSIPQGKTPDDVITIPSLNTMAKERTGYPTQKPLALLKWIVTASSNAGDVVFDPFCGCATALVAAQQLERRWIGIDIEEKAAGLLVQRLSDDAGLFKDFVHLTSPPVRTDVKVVEATVASVKKRLYKKQKRKCNGCESEYQMKDMEVDHIVPKSRGGGDFMENYQLLCGNCNRIKGNRPMEFLLMTLSNYKKHLRNKITFKKVSDSG